MTSLSGVPDGRTLAIGDVHGCDTALAALLDMVAPAAEDTLVFLGDLVDRGPNSRRVLELVLELQQRCQMILIQGNHEEMMLNALNGLDWRLWMVFGGRETIDSYGGAKQRMPASHVELLESAIDYWETPSHIFIHANLQPHVPLSEQGGDFLRWTHLTGQEDPYDPDRVVICGHTPQKSGYPWQMPGWVCIDTFAHGGGWLTCLDVADNWVRLANDFGETREFPLGSRE